jgi:hypothetical protein
MVADKALWRDTEPDQFAAATVSAAEHLGVLPLAIEKDYWACAALRAITLAHPGEVIFKGGTSLEKLRSSDDFPKTSTFWWQATTHRITQPSGP